MLIVSLLFGLGLLSSPLRAEAPPPAPSSQPGQPAAAASGNNIKIFDDSVFNLNGGTTTPETRKGPDGTTRYLDNTRELDYNTEQRDRWLKNCASLKDTDSKAFKDCYDNQKKKELGSRTNFGTREGGREPSTGGSGLNTPAGKPPLMRPSNTPATEAESAAEAEAETESNEE